MQTINSISRFFEQTDTHYRIFDIGRRISPLSRSQFSQFEDSKMPYPSPMQRQAWLGVLGWTQQPAQHFVWFLKFPLDELGQLAVVARDDFLAKLLENIGARLLSAEDTVNQQEKLQDSLNNSAYGFKPKENSMAIFHAKASKIMGQPASKYYTHAREYLGGKPGYEQWAFVGLQGLADVAARLDEDDNEAVVARALTQLPYQPFNELCICLENENIGTAIAEALAERINAELDAKQPEIPLVVAAIRGLSFAQAEGLRRKLLGEILTHDIGTDIEILAAISGKCWKDIYDESIGHCFVETLARNSVGLDAFHFIMADLLFIPGMREPLFKQLRDPERSDVLAQAVGKMFSS